MWSANDIKSTLKQNSFFGVLDGIKDGVENKIADPTQRGALGEQNNVQAGTTEGAITRNADGSMSIYANGSWQPYNSVLGDGAGGGTTTTTTGTGGGSTTDYGAIADSQSLIDQYNSGLARLGGQRTTGFNNILAEYNKQYTGLNDKKAVDLRDYTTKKDQTLQDFQNSKNQISSGVRNQQNSMQRLLGSYGAGSSAASELLVPFLAAKMGTAQREQVGQTYGRNLSGLDTAWDDTDRAYKGAYEDLASQKTTQERDYEAKVAQQEADYRSKIAEQQAAQVYARTGNAAQARAIIAAAQPTINDLYAKIDALAANPSFSIKDFKYQAPDLAQYNYEKPGLPSSQQADLPANTNPAFWGFFQDPTEKDKTNTVA